MITTKQIEMDNWTKVFDVKVWVGCIVTTLTGYLGADPKSLQFIGIHFRLPTVTELQKISLCVSILAGIITCCYTAHKWYLLRKKK
jgi:hypothetical protein